MCPLDRNHENYTTYEELEEYVQSYQAGDEEAAFKIIKAFEGFLKDYTLLVHKGVFNIQDPKMREFVRLYMKNYRQNIHQYRHKSRVRAELYRTSSRIYETFSVLNYDELHQELVLALLVLAKRYRVLPDKPRFHVYMMRTFHFEARRRLQNLFYYESQRTIKNYIADVNEEEEDMAFEEWRMEDNLFQERSSFSTIESEEVIDDEWIAGWKAGSYFTNLTPLERRIIKLYYWDNYSDQQIADQLGMCRVTINRYRLRAKENVRQQCEGFHLFHKEED